MEVLPRSKSKLARFSGKLTRRLFVPWDRAVIVLVIVGLLGVFIVCFENGMLLSLV